MLKQLRPAVSLLALLTLLTGVVYPLTVTGIAQLAFPAQANGSLVKDAKGTVIGSSLIAQGFAKPEYLHPRPSAAGNGYDASASSGSNMGPLNDKLIEREKTDAAALRARLEEVNRQRAADGRPALPLPPGPRAQFFQSCAGLQYAFG